MNTKPKVVVSIAREELETVLRKGFADESRRLIKLHESAPALLAMLERVTNEYRLLGNVAGLGDENPTVSEARALIETIKGE